jgi:putative transposase
MIFQKQVSTSWDIISYSVQSIGAEFSLIKYKKRLKELINDKAKDSESAGMKVIKVDPKDTTQECSRYHNVEKGRERLALKEVKR